MEGALATFFLIGIVHKNNTMGSYSEASQLGIVFVHSENKTYQYLIHITVYASIGLDEKNHEYSKTNNPLTL